MIVIKKIEDLLFFLESLGVRESERKRFVSGKRVLVNDYGIFLGQRTSEKCFFMRELIFLKLRRMVPTLRFLKELASIGRSYNVKSFKEALNFTYGKNLSLKFEFPEGFCIVLHNRFVLGLGEVRGNRIINVFNVGEYLKES